MKQAIRKFLQFLKRESIFGFRLLKVVALILSSVPQHAGITSIGASIHTGSGGMSGFGGTQGIPGISYGGYGGPGGGFAGGNSAGMQQAGQMLSFVNPFLGVPGAPGQNIGGAMNLMGSASINSMMLMMMAGGLATSAVNSALEISHKTRLNAELLRQESELTGPDFTQDDSFFPACKVLPAQAPHLSDMICNPNSIKNEGQEIQARVYMRQAELYAKSYEQILIRGKDFDTDVGLQCVVREEKKLYDRLNADRQQIKNLIDRLKKSANEFAVQVKPILDDLGRINFLLDGQVREGVVVNRDDRSRELSELFNNDACRESLDINSIPNTAGLYSIRDTIKGTEEKAARFEKDNAARVNGRNRFERLFDEDLARLNREDSTDVASSTGLHYGIVATIFEEEKRHLEEEYKQMKDRLSQATGVQLPDTVDAFNRGLDAENLPGKEDLERIFVNRCIDENGMSSNEIVGSVIQVASTNGAVAERILTGVSLDKYKQQLTAIFNQNLSSQERIDAIKALDNPNDRIDFRILAGGLATDPRNPGAQTNIEEYVPVSTLLESYQTYCIQIYNNEPIGNARKQTRAKLVDEELQNFQGIASKIGGNNDQIKQRLAERIFSCKEIDYSPGPEFCNNSTFDPKNENFCIPNAISCSRAVQTCLSQARKEINSREVLAKQKANEYNNRVNNLMDQQEFELQKVRNLVQSNAQVMNAFFPGGKFELPKDNLFIQKPMTSDQAFGSFLIGDGNLNFMDQIGQTLTSMLASMQAQETQIKEMVIKPRKEELEKQYKRELRYWANNVLKKCATARDQYTRLKQQQANQMRRWYQQEFQKMMQFCAMLAFAYIGPGCEGTSQMLTMSAGNALGMLGFGTEAMKVQQIAQLCNAMMSSRMMEFQDPVVQQFMSGQGDPLQLCRMSGYSTDGLLVKFNDFAASNGWQLVAGLKAKHGMEITIGEMDQLIKNGAKPAQINMENPLEGNINYKGINTATIRGSSMGYYLDVITRLNGVVKKMKLQNKGGRGYCEEIQRRVQDEIQKKSGIYQKCMSMMGVGKDGAPAAGGNMMGAAMVMGGGGGGEGGAGGAGSIRQCIEGLLGLDIEGDRDLGQSMKALTGLISNLSTLQQKIPAEMGFWVSNRMGQTPNIGCAAAFMNGRAFMGPEFQVPTGGSFNHSFDIGGAN